MIKKILPYLIVGIVIYLLYRCEEDNVDKYDKEIENLERQRDSLEIERIKAKDSLTSEISVRELQNSNLEQENILLFHKLKQKKNVVITPPSDYVNYFNDRYNTKENKPFGSYIGLGENTSVLVFSDLYNFDILKEVEVLQTKIIENKDAEISNLNKDKVNLKSLIADCEKSLAAVEKLDSTRKKQVSVLKSKKYSFGISVGTDTKLTTPLIKIDAGYKGYEAGYIKANNTDFLMVGRRWSW